MTHGVEPCESPWTSHLRGIKTIGDIARMVRVGAQALSGLGDAPVEVACRRIEAAWDAIYIPSESECRLLLEFVEVALAYANEWFRTKKAFLGTIFSGAINIPPVFPFCVTGLSGVGKSALRRALERLFTPPASTIAVSDEYEPFPWIPMRSALIENGPQSTLVFAALAGPGSKLKQTMVECRGSMYRSGACFAVLDEMQFLTHGEDARAMAARLLLSAASLGMPLAYFCNFSMVYKMLKLPHESRQRLLARLRLVTPCSPRDPLWAEYLQELQAAVPGLFAFNLVDRATELWNYSAGLKRNLQQLLKESFRASRRVGETSVSWSTVESTYLHTDYFSTREEVEQLLAHAMGNTKIKRDLMCPFASPSNNEYQAALRSLLQQRFGKAVEDSVLNEAEKKELAKIKSDLSPVPAAQRRRADPRPRTAGAAAPAEPADAISEMRSVALVKAAYSLLQPKSKSRNPSSVKRG
ncbi:MULTISPECIES: hypothetical protein [unclassified Variovorax]|uniref:hypothetical protein n=1 Tax=unclassified Variovorax TaxID=663243 RepID=UPI003F4785A6